VSIQDLLAPALRGRQLSLEDVMSLGVIIEAVSGVREYQVPVPSCEGEDGRIQLFDKGLETRARPRAHPSPRQRGQ
jgi:hypothetical protein